MDGIHICDFCRADYPIYAQIALGAGSFTDTNGFISKLYVHRVCVHLRIDGHRADIQLLAGANDTNGYLASVRYQNLLKHLANQCYRTAQPRELDSLANRARVIRSVES